MKFLLFNFDPVAPRGGWGDFMGAYDTQEEAQSVADEITDAYQIVDLERRTVVKAGKAKRS